MSREELQHHISDTAFLVNESRARRDALSRDRFARHWIPPHLQQRVKELWGDFAREVYPHDDLELAVRNRFFLDELESFFTDDGGVFANIGAGFTSYPFLLSRERRSIEVDYPPVSRAKAERMRQLQAEDVLPQRAVEFLAADLDSAEDRRKLQALLDEALRDTPSYLLCEGVLYYLHRESIEALFAQFEKAQTSGSRIGLDFWEPSVAESAVFRRQERFFEDRFGFRSSAYCFFDSKFLESLSGYRLVVSTGVAEQERRFAGTEILSDPESMLPNEYAVLQRV